MDFDSLKYAAIFNRFIVTCTYSTCTSLLAYIDRSKPQNLIPFSFSRSEISYRSDIENNTLYSIIYCIVYCIMYCIYTVECSISKKT